MRQHCQRGSRAVTLLELIIVLFIGALVMAMMAGFARNALLNEDVREAGRKLALFAKTARKQAMHENREYEVVLLSDSILLRPAQADDNAVTKPDADPAEETGPKEPLEYHFAEGIKFKVKFWGTSDWIEAAQDELIWTFPATGLCAPHSFRFEKGEAWMEETFNPLTANRQDESYYLP